jgi:hypothetical protein
MRGGSRERASKIEREGSRERSGSVGRYNPAYDHDDD